MKPLTTDALRQLVSLSDPRIAPPSPGAAPTDALCASTDVLWNEGEPPRYRSRLMRIDLREGVKGSRIKPLTQGENDRSGRWSPDGRRVAFLRSELGSDGKPKSAALMLIDLDGGEARTLYQASAGVRSFLWRDAERLLLITRGERRDEAALQGLGRSFEHRTQRFDGVGWVTVGEVDLLEVSTSGDAEVLGTLPQAPSEMALSPDGSALGLLGPKDLLDLDAGVTRLWHLPLPTRGPKGRKGAALRPRDLLQSPLRASSLSWSPRGDALTFVAPSDLRGFGLAPTLWSLATAAKGGKGKGAKARPVALSSGLELGASTSGDVRYGAFPTAPVWHPSGEALSVVVAQQGRAHLGTLSLDGVLTARTRGDRVVTSFDACGETVLMSVERADRPGVMVLLSPSGREQVVADPNAAWCEGHRLLAPVERRLKSGDGTPLRYLLYTPERPRRDQAVVVQVHGGPHANDGFGFRFEIQRMLAAGYHVVTHNPRGSTSFGEAHSMAVIQRYGTIDAEDVMAVTEHALAQHRRPSAPVHLTGGSYGGFMTNWLVGTQPQRFRSAVTQRSICNWVSMFGTADIGPYFVAGEVAPAPWIDVDALWAASPLKYAAAVTTPTLVLHSENDFRCPIEQGEQWFTALRMLGRAPTRMIRFPDEGHELSRSGRLDRRMQRIDAIVGWFEEHP